MSKNISLNDMITQIRQWQLETDDFRNDSWTKDEYKSRLTELYGHLSGIINNVNVNYRKPTPESEQKED
ncbi:MAG: hypothetical protein HOI21_06095 [Bacteroidetes Order II. Incertae sedis bacterium]|nr:hypothetical protein [Bacteroidetes Order II. bacterium]